MLLQHSAKHAHQLPSLLGRESREELVLNVGQHPLEPLDVPGARRGNRDDVAAAVGWIGGALVLIGPFTVDLGLSRGKRSLLGLRCLLPIAPHCSVMLAGGLSNSRARPSN
jgi:hypothetical protein